MSFLVRVSDQLGQPIEPKAMPQPNSLAVDSRRVRCLNDGSDGDVNPCAIFSSVLTLQLDHLCTRIRHSTERPQLGRRCECKGPPGSCRGERGFEWRLTAEACGVRRSPGDFAAVAVRAPHWASLIEHNAASEQCDPGTAT